MRSLISIKSEYQTAGSDGGSRVEVLLPEETAAGTRCLYVLPVEPGQGELYGNPLPLLEAIDAANRYRIIIVYPRLAQEPWYGDHATDRGAQQARYLRQDVAPTIEATYGIPARAENRLLLGFSKSGWGAFSLLLRHPEFWGYAASWDAPLLLEELHYGMEAVFGTHEQLDHYRPGALIPRQKHLWCERIRLVLAGENGWGTSIPAPGGGSHTAETHVLLESAGIPHVYLPRVSAEHRWDVGWMEPVLTALMNLAV